MVGDAHTKTRAQPDLAYEFHDQIEPDNRIGWTGPAGRDWIWTYIFDNLLIFR